MSVHESIVISGNSAYYERNDISLRSGLTYDEAVECISKMKTDHLCAIRNRQGLYNIVYASDVPALNDDNLRKRISIKEV